MKTLKIVVLAMVLSMFFATPSMAVLRKDIAVVQGKVVYVTKTEITVKDSTTGKEVFFSLKKFPDPTITVGANVIVVYKKGTTVANSVRLADKKAGGSMGGYKASAAPAPTPAPAAPAQKKASWY